jgi:hypothetical protein
MPRSCSQLLAEVIWLVRILAAGWGSAGLCSVGAACARAWTCCRGGGCCRRCGQHRCGGAEAAVAVLGDAARAVAAAVPQAAQPALHPPSNCSAGGEREDENSIHAGQGLERGRARGIARAGSAAGGQRGRFATHHAAQVPRGFMPVGRRPPDVCVPPQHCCRAPGAPRASCRGRHDVLAARRPPQVGRALRSGGRGSQALLPGGCRRNRRGARGGCGMGGLLGACCRWTACGQRLLRVV